MPNALLIAEKPSLRKKIEAVYNANASSIPYKCTFTEQRGHLVTLVLPDEIDDSMKKWDWDTLPFHPEDYGGWRYKIIQERKTGTYLTAQERFENIKKEIESGKYDFIINAGDPDQEGELLIRSVLEKLKNKLPVKRFWTNDVTDAAILKALQNLRDDDKDPQLVNLLRAARGRQHSDYRFGMNISRAVSLKLRIRSACGRVKTPILAMICKRENEIANFKPTTVYGIKVLYTEKFEGNLFNPATAIASSEEEKKEDAEKGIIWFDTKTEADDFLKKIASINKLHVSAYNSVKKETYAPKLFKLATAQVAAGKIGYNPTKADEIIQSLYEKGYITYPRTDCEYLSTNDDLVAMLRSSSSIPELAPYIAKIEKTTISKVRATKKWVNDAELKEHGHSALAPTSSKPDFAKLTKEEQDIYTLICKQFVAIFLPPLVQNKVELVTTDGSLVNFKSTGSTTVSAGYTVIFGTKLTDNEIPTHKVGDILDVNKYDLTERTSTCPKRFSETDLIAACENPVKYLDDASLKALGKKLKIGTPATRAGIIETLIKEDKYLKNAKEGKRDVVVPTPNGAFVYDNIKDLGICKVDMTGEWEIRLEDVRSGKMSFEDFELSMRKDVEDMLKEIKSASMTASTGAKYPVVGKCPKCGGEILSGKKGFFCSKYKDGCKVGGYKNICDSTVTDAEFAKLLNGDIIKKTIKKGSTSWEQALIYNIDESKIDFYKDPSAPPKAPAKPATATAYKCPKCKGKIQENSKAFSCEKRDFTLWKTVCSVELSKEQIDNFFTKGNTGPIQNMVSKKGSTFTASLKLNKAKDGTEFEFN